MKRSMVWDTRGIIRGTYSFFLLGSGVRDKVRKEKEMFTVFFLGFFHWRKTKKIKKVRFHSVFVEFLLSNFVKAKKL